MKRISFASGAFVTGDAIATAVLDYAAALANANQSARIDVPGRDATTGGDRVQMVVGPASQILAVDEELGPEVEDEAFVHDLEARIARLRS